MFRLSCCLFEVSSRIAIQSSQYTRQLQSGWEDRVQNKILLKAIEGDVRRPSTPIAIS